MKPESKQALIVAGEASSSLYALRLLQEFKQQNIDLHCFGVGSREMEAEGFECIGRSEEMAVVGLQEVLSHYKDIKAVFDKLIHEVEKRKPSFILLLDYPDFNLRLAKKLKRFGIPIVYYISPQLWAWRTSRIKIIQKYIDKMLVVFPFEQPFYEKHNVDCEFVGHPLLDEVNDSLYTRERRHEHRARHGFDDSDFVVGLLPGSRTSELKLNLQAQVQAAELMYQRNNQLKFFLAIAPSFDIESIRPFLPEQINCPLVLVKREPFDMIRMADAILTASGTATMMVGLMHCPMVIMYKMKPVTAWLARRLVKGQKNFGMINLILGEEVCKELFQEQASPENMAEEVLKLTNENARQRQIEKLQRVNQKLGEQGASKRVAEILKNFL